ncbi:MAG TPA: UbiX family flavin prenyltransferase [Ferruginibacter sp.]|nr:UbiX family flavin prenyltransferase [Ferruginibacter sp.]HRE64287.1 UbiX family flavin prenyltransferase [Ferruginibacter sp.]
MQKIVVAVTGASGSIYARQLLTKLLQAKEQMEELSLVMSDNAQKVWQTELGSDSYKNLPIKIFDKKDFMAPFASGSAQYSTMIIIPCSMGTLGRIAHGISDDLITRTADVMLKERRKLICVARETPYNLIQIKNMELLTHAGGIICPATPSFYSRPQTVEEVVATVVDRVIDLAGIKQNSFRWGNAQ